jgi:hypothetical protein
VRADVALAFAEDGFGDAGELHFADADKRRGADKSSAAKRPVDGERLWRHPAHMTAIAQELDRRLQTLDSARAARCEQIVRDLLALFDEQEAPAPNVRRAYRTRTHGSGLLPGIDPTKLGQLADDL